MENQEIDALIDFDRIIHEPGWKAALADTLTSKPLQALRRRLLSELKAGKVLHPNPSEWFNAFNYTPLNRVRVVILAQDPYPTPGHAHGLCFSVRSNVQPLPKSLENIFRELKDDLGINNNKCGDLTRWSEQGVLLLNAVLTVESGKPGSHHGWGWERLTDKAIQILSKQPRRLVFVLWGTYAWEKCKFIDCRRHEILMAYHPTSRNQRKLPHRRFFGSRPFSKINQFLEAQGQTPIDWRTSCPKHSRRT